MIRLITRRSSAPWTAKNKEKTSIDLRINAEISQNENKRIYSCICWKVNHYLGGKNVVHLSCLIKILVSDEIILWIDHGWKNIGIFWKKNGFKFRKKFFRFQTFLESLKQGFWTYFPFLESTKRRDSVLSQISRTGGPSKPLNCPGSEHTMKQPTPARHMPNTYKWLSPCLSV